MRTNKADLTISSYAYTKGAMNKIKIANIPYFFLFALSFYPIMNEAVASITAILFLITAIFFYHKNLGVRFKKIGFKPLLVNCGFYLLVLLSIGYSDDIMLSAKKIQSTLLLLFFPVIVVYFFPKVDRKTIQFFSYGFIIANLTLLFYFFNILVEGLDIDRFAGLMEQDVITQFKAINRYPYEFVVSKAEKHLNLFYGTHKVYLSVHFLMALLLSFYLILDQEINSLKKILLGIISLIFIYAIFYSQAITTVFVMGFIIVVYPLLYIKGKIVKSIYVLLLVMTFSIVFSSGFFEKYDNTNTAAATKFIKGLFSSSGMEQGTDKRAFIYDCSIDLISKKPIFGYGIGDVQRELNQCYAKNDYTVAEYKSVDSEMNSHNYFFNLWLTGGILAPILLLYLFGNNSYYAWKNGHYTYLFFLFLIFVSLMTENLLVRMLGVFLFAIFNAMFYSNLFIDDKEEK